MAELKDADVSGDCPTVLWFDSFGIRIHDSVPLGNNIEEMANRRLAEPIDVIGGRRGKPRWTIMPLPSQPARGRQSNRFQSALGRVQAIRG